MRFIASVSIAALCFVASIQAAPAPLGDPVTGLVAPVTDALGGVGLGGASKGGDAAAPDAGQGGAEEGGAGKGAGGKDPVSGLTGAVPGASALTQVAGHATSGVQGALGSLGVDVGKKLPVIGAVNPTNDAAGQPPKADAAGSAAGSQTD